MVAKKLSRAKRQSNKDRSFFSFSFLLAIPSNFILGAVCFISAFALFDTYGLAKELWVTTLAGIIGGLMIVGTAKMPKFRTFIHEFKHYLVVRLTGNIVKDFHFDTHTGHVEFQMYSDKVRFAPFISLAPYFLPILSLPVLVFCIALEGYARYPLNLLLGLAFATDLALSFQELHPHQTDLKRVPGSYIGSFLYLAGFHFLWINLLAIWVIAGREGYLFTAYLIADLVQAYAGLY